MPFGLLLALIICGFILAVTLVIAAVYFIISTRRRNALYRKFDLLVEDLTYKLEVLNPAVETVAKLANYFDAFEIATRKSLKASVRYIARNRDDIYKLLERIKRALLGAEAGSAKSKTRAASQATSVHKSAAKTRQTKARSESGKE